MVNIAVAAVVGGPIGGGAGGGAPCSRLVFIVESAQVEESSRNVPRRSVRRTVGPGRARAAAAKVKARKDVGCVRERRRLVQEETNRHHVCGRNGGDPLQARGGSQLGRRRDNTPRGPHYVASSHVGPCMRMLMNLRDASKRCQVKRSMAVVTLVPS